ncbi:MULTISPECIES: hypothetical protein [unclassified Enterococcus]|uniref:hypothetical protein n=1 Tax=unclassified Enterococcus TaxID=2608891 RepID=UPI0015543631|nr:MULTISPECIES: hypothetical protein [unclassified Enterococcus]MBS7576982.1 hypothetical protein [Enterococcus sp. MMGLQ5-2]MBS7584571.1 hypothetical protein [Enterococcus sp. MMGLQ5-1]NPD12426.1 hypothetical protein [Enterococcus sp. MMGLQ5-1]NPD36816.1 hypothetical protein [Enterococcus sp. MMGLQ5-2]
MKKILNISEEHKELSVLIKSNIDDSVYKRFFIVPCSWSKATINSYLVKSLKTSSRLIVSDENQKVMVFQNSIRDYPVNNINSIDYYWHDVKEFIVEIRDNYFVYPLSVITGCTFEENDIQHFLMNYFPNQQIVINYYRDLWLNKLSMVDL